MLIGMSAPDATAQSVETGGVIFPGVSLGSLCVLIPVWGPTASLLSLVAQLSQRGFGKLLIVDDGSSPGCAAVFAKIETLPGVEVLRHAVNLGKGRALKTGFSRLLAADKAFSGVVTADADGQHTPEDIEKVARALLSSSLLSNELRPVLGTRGFDFDVPWRSRLGNRFTRHLFNLLTGVHLADTQTGLRGFPLAVLPELLALKGERYEYEMTVLAHLCRSGRTPLEVPIATVYLNNNRGSHFHPVWDSMRVYSVLLGLVRVLAGGRAR